MAKLLKLRRGTTTQHSSFTGAEGECTVDTTKDTLVVHDGSTAGGRPLLRQDLSNLANDSIDSEHYVDGSIDTAHLSNGAVTSEKIADANITSQQLGADCIDGGNIQDDSINSEHYADGSIDTAHIADDQITQAKIANNAVGLDELAGIARGKIIYGDSSGNPAVLAPGTADQVLTSDGTDIAWGAASAGAKGGNSGANAVFWENQQTVTHDYTITNNTNAGSFGPITINSSITVTVGAGENWTVI